MARILPPKGTRIPKDPVAQLAAFVPAGAAGGIRRVPRFLLGRLLRFFHPQGPLGPLPGSEALGNVGAFNLTRLGVGKRSFQEVLANLAEEQGVRGRIASEEFLGP